MPKIISKKYLPPAGRKLVPKIKNAQNLLKFGRFDILNMPISTLMLKMVNVNV